MNLKDRRIVFIFLNFTNLSVLIAATHEGVNHDLPLSGRNVVVASLSSVSGIIVQRNASGQITQATGIPVLMLEWMSKEYNFTFSYHPTNSNTIESTASGQKGLIDFIINGECDIILPLVPTPSRVKFLEFAHPYLGIPVSYLIPFGNPFASLSGVLKPFQTLVWVGILFFSGLTTLLFCLLNKILLTLRPSFLRNNNNKKPDCSDNRMHVIPIYVLGVGLSQGGYCTCNRLPIRIIAACWCLACFVIVNSYSSTLVAFLTLPYPDILINGIGELRDRPDIRLVTDKGVSTEALLLTSDSGLRKALGDKLRSYPLSSCNTTQQCLALVKSGSHVYTAGTDSYLYKGMKDDFSATGACNFRLGKGSYMSLDLSWGLPKRSPHLEGFNIGIMRVREFGLLKQWKSRFQADASYCLRKAKERPVNPALSKRHLVGAFIVLGVGYLSSLLVFLLERRMQYVKQRRNRISCNT